MEKTPDQPTSYVYLILGIFFVMFGFLLKGMIAFTGVGAAFLFMYYRQRRDKKE
ncbi:hypothetical protein [Spirosoma validum]|uniref:Uncharacterized protein n=1 Tax=Spirosoma validum TaxID=2771355 RepID=A0A927B2Q8_9BACT|nr:hypothetical protein [Spirosoma validum]MBD2754289.1 hypothetical protein [Spirosoma validum]